MVAVDDAEIASHWLGILRDCVSDAINAAKKLDRSLNDWRCEQFVVDLRKLMASVEAYQAERSKK